MGRKDYYHEENAPKPNSIVPAASAVVLNQAHHGLFYLQCPNDIESRLAPG